MDYKLHTDHQLRVVTLEFIDTLTIESARNGTIELNNLALKLGYNKLFDVSGAILSASIGDTYFFPREMMALYKNPKYRSLKIGILYSDDVDRDFWKFYENTSQNIGFIIKVFTSRKEALEWLSEK